MVGSGHQLKLRLNRAGPRHGDELAASDLKIENWHHCLLAPRALQAIWSFGKSFLPLLAHLLRSVSGEAEVLD
jgi:hypothetical protein